MKESKTHSYDNYVIQIWGYRYFIEYINEECVWAYDLLRAMNFSSRSEANRYIRENNMAKIKPQIVKIRITKTEERELI